MEDSSHNPLTNAPVTFAIVAPSDGQVVRWITGSGGASLTVNTDSTGTAHAYYIGASAFGATNAVQVTAGGSSVSFTENTHWNNGDMAAPTGITVTAGSSSGQMILNWTNNTTSATYIVVQQSTDNVNWKTIVTIAPTATSYTVNETDPTKSYYFGVIAGKP